MSLNRDRSVKEEKLGFVEVEGHARGFSEVREDGTELGGFLVRGGVQKEGIINELAVREGGLKVVQREALKRAFVDSSTKIAA
jgi:hypothetical protein